MKTRNFLLEDILSFTTGKMLAPGGRAALRELAAFLTRDDAHLVNDSALQAYEDICTIDLLTQHPKLEDFQNIPTYHTEQELDAWVEKVKSEMGATLTLTQRAIE